MEIEIMKHWEVAVDGVQIFLCLLIIFFLIRNLRRSRKPDWVNPLGESGRDFNLQVFSQTIAQQVELAFANIMEAAAIERRNLEKFLQIDQLHHTNHSSPRIRPPSVPSHRDDTWQRDKTTAGKDERRARIQKLATRGMSAKQISEELKTPLGEVELILSLQKAATD